MASLVRRKYKHSNSKIKGALRALDPARLYQMAQEAGSGSSSSSSDEASVKEVLKHRKRKKRFKQIYLTKMPPPVLKRQMGGADQEQEEQVSETPQLGMTQPWEEGVMPADDDLAKLAAAVRRRRTELQTGAGHPRAHPFELGSRTGANEVIVKSGNPILFEHPCRIVLLGPSSSGKTTLVKRILSQRDKLFKPAPLDVNWFYQVESAATNLKRDLPEVNFIKGMPNRDDIFKRDASDPPAIIVIDDMAARENGKEDIKTMESLFSAVRHANVTIIILLHSIAKMAKVMNNATHLIGMLNGAGADTVYTAANNVYAHGRKPFFKFCGQETKNLMRKKYPYLVVTAAADDDCLICRTRVLDGDQNTFFAPAGMTKSQLYLDLKDSDKVGNILLQHSHLPDDCEDERE